MKETPFRQSAAGNCSLYSLANLFNDERFIADIVPGRGQDTFELNKVLTSLREDCYASADWVLPLGQGRISDFADCLHYRDEECEPDPEGAILYVVIVAVNNDTMLHAIGVIGETKPFPRWWVADSLRRGIQAYSLREFLDAYHVKGLLNIRKSLTPDEAAGVASNVCRWNLADFAHLVGDEAEAV